MTSQTFRVRETLDLVDVVGTAPTHRAVGARPVVRNIAHLFRRGGLDPFNDLLSRNALPFVRLFATLTAEDSMEQVLELGRSDPDKSHSG
ncbi:MAG: hypothetical protein AB7G75_37710 [Candidatus Binatia bacterium]